MQKAITAATPYCFSLKMDAKRCALILAPIFLGLLLYFPSEAADVKGLVNNLCKRSDNYAYCTQTLLTNPKIASASNIKGIAKIALDVGQKKSIEAQNFFNSLSKQSGIGGASKPALVSCASSFKNAATFFNLRGLSGGTASLDVHYAQDAFQICENALATAKLKLPSVSATMDQWKKLYSVAYATVLAVEEASASSDY